MTAAQPPLDLSALYDIRALAQFAYDQGFHEMGYDPVLTLTAQYDALLSEVGAGCERIARLEEALKSVLREVDWHVSEVGLVLRGMGTHNIEQARAALASRQPAQESGK